MGQRPGWWGRRRRRVSQAEEGRELAQEEEEYFRKREQQVQRFGVVRKNSTVKEFWMVDGEVTRKEASKASMDQVKQAGA